MSAHFPSVVQRSRRESDSILVPHRSFATGRVGASCDEAKATACLEEYTTSQTDTCGQAQLLYSTETASCFQAISCCGFLDNMVADEATVPAGCEVSKCANGHGQTVDACTDTEGAAECIAGEEALCRMLQGGLSPIADCLGENDCCKEYDEFMGSLNTEASSTCKMAECGGSPFLRSDWMLVGLVAIAASVFNRA